MTYHKRVEVKKQVNHVKPKVFKNVHRGYTGTMVAIVPSKVHRKKYSSFVNLTDAELFKELKLRVFWRVSKAEFMRKLKFRKLPQTTLKLKVELNKEMKVRSVNPTLIFNRRKVAGSREMSRMLNELIIADRALHSFHVMFRKSEIEYLKKQKNLRQLLKNLKSIFANIGEEEDALETMQKFFNRAENNFRMRMIRLRREELLSPKPIVVEESSKQDSSVIVPPAPNTTTTDINDESKQVSSVPVPPAQNTNTTEIKSKKATPKVEKVTPAPVAEAHPGKNNKHKRIKNGINLLNNLVKNFSNKKKVHVSSSDSNNKQAKKSAKNKSGKNKKLKS
jgi:hypothetical protein